MTKFVIPPEALQQNIAVLGKNGSGKTYAAKAAIVEPLLELGRCVCVIDPTGAWWGLRTSRDGKGPGFPVLVLGGDHGDLPLPANGGAAVARLVLEQRVSLVADTTQLTVGERTRWFTDFAGTLYRGNRTPLNLIIDEAHNFAPQGKVPDPDAGKMLHAASTLASQGRSRGIRLTMITQRPQKLHKDSLTSADALIAMRVIHPLDRGAVADWINGCGDPAKGKAVLDSLANLQRGEGWAWYPEGGFLQRMKFPHIVTFDSSATPVDGAPVPKPKGAAAIDLGEIKAALADAVREAEANDPKLLRARIAELERAGKGVPETEVQRRIRDALAAAKREAPVAPAPVQSEDKVARAALERIVAVAQKVLGSGASVSGPTSQVEKINTAPRVARQSRATPAPGAIAAGLTGPRQRILDAIAQLEQFGLTAPNKLIVAATAGVSPRSSGYANNLGGLRVAGLIDYPSGGAVALTDAGRQAANAPTRAVSLTELHDAFLAILSAPQATILRCAIGEYPRPIQKDDLARAIGVSNLSSGYANNLGSLRSLGVIDYPQRGFVRASDVLFPVRP